MFKGAIKTLNGIDYIIAEVNLAEVYKDCAKVDELDKFLGEFDFVRKDTNFAGMTWGDALYIRKSLVIDTPPTYKGKTAVSVGTPQSSAPASDNGLNEFGNPRRAGFIG